MKLLSQTEGQPNDYPDVTSLTTEQAALNLPALWQRIEHWIAWRWAERTVTWIVEGEGDWFPPLTPYTITTAERWTGSEYEAVSLNDAPLGLRLNGGTYRITATVGSTETPPGDVLEAFRRLAEYLAADNYLGPVNNNLDTSMADFHFSARRAQNWHARALEYSGAADLLRRYRTA